MGVALLLLAGLEVVAAVEPWPAHATFPGRPGVLAVTYGFRCTGRQVALLTPNGQSMRMITAPDCSTLGGPERASWSPSGGRLLFERQLPYIPNQDPIRFALMKADGSMPRDIPLTPATVTGSEWAFTRFDPSFTPDGKHLIYTRALWGPPVYRTELWSAALDGSDDRRLGSGQDGRISPDGRLVAYAQSQRLASDGRNTEVGETWLMSARTGKPIRRLWRAPARSIDWAPDSKRIVFTASRRKTDVDPDDVYTVRANGTSLRRVTSTSRASETDAVWSPDGRRLAVVRELRHPIDDESDSTTQAIWMMRPDGTAPRRLRGPWTGSSEDGRGGMKISWQPRRRR